MSAGEQSHGMQQRRRRRLIFGDDIPNTPAAIAPLKTGHTHLDQMREKYNFDFETETPLPGRYEWIKVDPDQAHGP